MDDATIDTEGYPEDTDDDILEGHIEHCELFLQAALPRRIQFKMEREEQLRAEEDQPPRLRDRGWQAQA